VYTFVPLYAAFFIAFVVFPPRQRENVTRNGHNNGRHRVAIEMPLYWCFQWRLAGH